MNLLSQRIKDAKKELTALKTNHQRGLGMLKVYKYEYTIPPPPDEELSFWWLSMTFTFSTSAYPFLQRDLVFDRISRNLMYTAQEFEYTNDGWSATISARYGNLNRNYEVAVYCTSPITSMSYSWSQ